MKEATRSTVRKAILARRGELARIAEELGVHRVTVSLVLRGKSTSDRIMAACRARAAELTSEIAAQEDAA